MKERGAVPPAGTIIRPIVLLALLALLAASACARRAHQGTFRPERFSSLQERSPGWPWGESGAGPLMHIAESARDPRYGWTEARPIRLGGYPLGLTEAAERQIRYLNSLWGPRGQVLLYEKVGTCCPFDWPGAPMDRGTLDVFELRGEGFDPPRHLYLDPYREEIPRIPLGLTSRVPPPAAGGGG